jgi:adenosylhomocysteine nucleosidase
VTHDGADGGVVVLFALEREAAPFRRAARGLNHIRIHVTGIGRRRARAAAELTLTGPPPRLVIAAGFCGALVAGLRAGDVVTDRIVTVDRLVADPSEKRRLAEESQAIAVDMESDAVAAVCVERGVPFRVVRAVSDTVDTALSPRLVRLLAGGRVSPLKAVATLARQPSLLGEFRRLARDTRLAAANLAAELARVVKQQSPPVATGGL